MTLWLTGLPSAGKTTLARALVDLLEGPREHLDGDELRTWLSAGAGYSRADRSAHVRRVGRLTHLLTRHGVSCVVSIVSPYAEDRAWVRDLHQQSGYEFREVYVSTPLTVCEERDAKGLYAAARRGERSLVTGVDDPYEVPTEPFFVTRPDLGAQASARAVVEALDASGYRVRSTDDAHPAATG